MTIYDFVGVEVTRLESEKLETPHVVSYNILLLPGSRTSELKRHLPVMLAALKTIQEKLPAAKAKMVLPNPALVSLAKSLGADLEIQIGNCHGRWRKRMWPSPRPAR